MGYEDWEYKVGIFLNSKCPLFAFSRASQAEKSMMTFESMKYDTLKVTQHMSCG